MEYARLVKCVSPRKEGITAAASSTTSQGENTISPVESDARVSPAVLHDRARLLPGRLSRPQGRGRLPRDDRHAQGRGHRPERAPLEGGRDRLQLQRLDERVAAAAGRPD